MTCKEERRSRQCTSPLLLVMEYTEYSSSLHLRRQPTCAIEDKEYNAYSIVNHQASLQEIRLCLGLLLASTQGHQVYPRCQRHSPQANHGVWSAIQPTKHESHEHRNSIIDAVGIASVLAQSLLTTRRLSGNPSASGAPYSQPSGVVLCF